MAKRKPKGRGRPAKQQGRTTKSKPRGGGGKKGASGLAPAAHVEQFMSAMFGAGNDPKFDAQQLAYDAMEALGEGAVDRAIELAVAAIEMDADCIDARMLLAEIDPPNDEAQIEELQEIVECGARSLGKRFFKENAGYFWGLLETRPYMRARATLAILLMDAGRRDEAVGHYEEMLALNPNDNQGLRYVLLGLYLELGRLDDARRILEQYPGESSAMFTWSRVLERFLADDLEGAREALGPARASNHHVEKYFTGKKRLPKGTPDFYSPGQDSEAVICVREIGAAWRQCSAAREWLKQQASERGANTPRKARKVAKRRNADSR